MENNINKTFKSLSTQIEKFTKDKIKNLNKPKLKTGFSDLDKLLGGGISPGVIVLGAMSGLGKSTLLLQLAQNISKQGIPVLYFSLEMPDDRIAAKAISRQIFIDNKLDKKKGITAEMLINHEARHCFDETTWKIIDEARTITLEECQNLFIFERKNEMISASKISEKVDAFIEKEKKKPIVIVDYLQILSPDKNSSRVSDKQIADENVEQMSALSRGRGIPVMLISSLNRESYHKPVQLESLKESGSIEYSADVVLGLQFSKVRENNCNLDEEKSKFPRKVELVALKQRYGISGSSALVKFDYYAEFDLFQEQSKSKSVNNKPMRMI